MVKIHPSLRIIQSLQVQELLEMSKRRAQRFLRHVRVFFGKQHRQPVTLLEFCQFTGFAMETVCQRFGWPYWSIPSISSPLKKPQL